jgi:hypothetical protein
VGGGIQQSYQSDEVKGPKQGDGIPHSSDFVSGENGNTVKRLGATLTDPKNLFALQLWDAAVAGLAASRNSKRSLLLRLDHHVLLSAFGAIRPRHID